MRYTQWGGKGNKVRILMSDKKLNENKEKAIKAFSEMIAKDCAGLIETLIEKRVRIYATHLAEIMQEDDKAI